MGHLLLLLGDATSPHVKRWAGYFAGRGWQVHVASFRATTSPDYTVHHLQGGLPGRLGYLTAVPRLRALVRALRPALVHAHYATSYGLMGALAGHHPYVISAWGSDLNEFGQAGAWQRAVLRFSFDRADMVTGVVQDLVDKARAIGSGRARWELTPFGVDTTVFSPDATVPRARVIGSVRPLEQRYGLDLLIEAFGVLGLDDVELELVGKGPDRARYEARLAELGVATRVRWRSGLSLAELVAAYRSFAVFVAPSRMEGICVSCLEANACATPAVVTRVGGLPEVVLEGVTGRVVAPGEPAALAAALRELLGDDARRARMGAAARARVLECFDWRDNAALMERLYLELIEAGRA